MAGILFRSGHLCNDCDARQTSACETKLERFLGPTQMHVEQWCVMVGLFSLGSKWVNWRLSLTVFDWTHKNIVAALGPVTGSIWKLQSSASVCRIGSPRFPRQPDQFTFPQRCYFAPHSFWLVIHLATILGMVSILIFARFFMVLSWLQPYIPQRS